MSTDELHVPEYIQAKCNDRLNMELQLCSTTEEITIVATLRVSNPKPVMPSAKDYNSRREWREACIKIRNEFYERETAATVAALQRLPLRVSPPEPSPLKVITGIRKNIIEALRLEGIKHASLDQYLEMLRKK